MKIPKSFKPKPKPKQNNFSTSTNTPPSKAGFFFAFKKANLLWSKIFRKWIINILLARNNSIFSWSGEWINKSTFSRTWREKIEDLSQIAYFLSNSGLEIFDSRVLLIARHTKGRLDYARHKSIIDVWIEVSIHLANGILACANIDLTFGVYDD